MKGAIHDRECATCMRLFNCPGKPEGTTRCLHYKNRGNEYSTVDDFIDHRSRKERPNTKKEEMAKYYDLTNKHVQIDPHTQRRLFDDEGRW